MKSNLDLDPWGVNLTDVTFVFKPPLHMIWKTAQSLYKLLCQS